MFPGEVRDRNIDYLLKHDKIVLELYGGRTQVTGASTVNLADFSGTTIEVSQLGTTGTGAVQFGVTSENLDIRWPVPHDLDKWNKIYFRVKWTSNYATANGTATWRLLYTAVADGTVAAVGSTALTKAIPISTKVAATARQEYWSPYGYLAPIATGAAAGQVLSDDTEDLMLRLNVNAVTGITLVSDFVFGIVLDIAYTPRKTYGDGSHREARMMKTNLGFQEIEPTSAP